MLKRMFNWLGEQFASFVFQWIMGGILALLVGVVLARLRSVNSAWAPILLYGLAGTVGVVLIVAGAQIATFLWRLRPSTEITSDNAPLITRQWLDDAGLNLAIRRRDAPEAVFVLDITMNGRNMTLSQPRNRLSYLMLGTNINIAQEVRTNLTNVPRRELMEMLRSLHAQLGFLGIQYRNLGPPFEGIFLMIAVPITSDLDKYELVRAINRLDIGIALTREGIGVFDPPIK